MVIGAIESVDMFVFEAANVFVPEASLDVPMLENYVATVAANAATGSAFGTLKLGLIRTACDSSVAHHARVDQCGGGGARSPLGAAPVAVRIGGPSTYTDVVCQLQTSRATTARSGRIRSTGSR